MLLPHYKSNIYRSGIEPGPSQGRTNEKTPLSWHGQFVFL